MKLTLLPILVGLPLATPVADAVPKLAVESSCKAAMSADSALGADRDQTYSSCMSDENQAQTELTKIWMNYPAPLRTRCEEEAAAGGLPSYVDLLVCLQVASESSTPGAPKQPVTTLRGASKRNAKKPATNH